MRAVVIEKAGAIKAEMEKANTNIEDYSADSFTALQVLLVDAFPPTTSEEPPK